METRRGGAVVRLGRKTYRLTQALTARELVVGEAGPAQRHLMARYQAASDEERASMRRVWAVALMRAQAVPWDTIREALNDEDPSRYQSLEIWRDVYEAAEEATLGEAAGDAIACLRKLLRSKREYVRAQAAAAILASRAKQWKQRREESGNIQINDGLTPEQRALYEQVRAMPADALQALLAQPEPITIPATVREVP